MRRICKNGLVKRRRKKGAFFFIIALYPKIAKYQGLLYIYMKKRNNDNITHDLPKSTKGIEKDDDDTTQKMIGQVYQQSKLHEILLYVGRQNKAR